MADKDVKTDDKKEPTKEELDAAKKEIEQGYRDLIIARKRFKRETEAHEVGKGKKTTLPEFGYTNIEKVTEDDIIKEKNMLEMEKFANDLLRVRVSPSVVQGDVPVIVVTVNGVNQAIIRGHEQMIKRKYVAALAQSRITSYVQTTPDGSKPDVIQMDDRTAPTYPFSVLEDPHPRGPDWLKAILAQP